MAPESRHRNEDQAKAFWSAIRDAKIAYNWMQDAIEEEDEKEIAIAVHNYDVAQDVLYASFVRWTGFDPSAF